MQLSGSIVGKNAEPPCLPESDSEAPSLARQDSHAFASLYELCRDDVFRYALRCLGNWDDAADATQQIFTNAFAAYPRFQGPIDSFRNWLFRIARNEVISRHRQRSRRGEYQLAGFEWIVDAGRTPEELAILADTGATLDALLHRLPCEQRRCCNLRFLGMSHAEIAVMLGKSEDAVRASYARGRAALRDCLRESERS